MSAVEVLFEEARYELSNYNEGGPPRTLLRVLAYFTKDGSVGGYEIETTIFRDTGSVVSPFGFTPDEWATFVSAIKPEEVG